MILGIILYLIGGLLYLAWAIWTTGDWDIADGWLPWWISYPVAILLWPIWVLKQL